MCRTARKSRDATAAANEIRAAACETAVDDLAISLTFKIDSFVEGEFVFRAIVF
jgi:hypothetical protein